MSQSIDPPQEGEDFYFNDSGLMVFTAAYHLKRGFCCRSGCLHCPYGFDEAESNANNNKTDYSG